MIQHDLTTPYHPQTNGQVERGNDVIKNMISMYVNEYHTDWNDYLLFVTFAYNTTVQTSTKMSPFELMYGRKVTTPEDYNFTVEVPKFDEDERVEFIEQ